MTMIWQQWEGTATTVATLPPLLQVHSRPFWLKAILDQGHLAQGHQMVVQVVVMAMVALMAIVMNDFGYGDDGDDEHGRH